MIDERFMEYIWQFKFFGTAIKTQEGVPLTVLHPGIKNHDSGPDFFNAKIRIGKTLWAGNVEIHVKSSDWYLHGHHNDSSFDNIILHVVHQNDTPVKRKNDEVIPTLELKDKIDPELIEKYKNLLGSLKWIPCQGLLGELPFYLLTSYFDALMIERLENRAQKIEMELEATGNNFHEVFYRNFLTAFGFKINNVAFELLAKSLPVNLLTKHTDNPTQLEALLFGQAGMLKTIYTEEYPKSLQREYNFLKTKYNLEPVDNKIWKFMRSRPQNFPSVRIAQFANIMVNTDGNLASMLRITNIKNLESLLTAGVSEYWTSHYRLGTPSAKRQKRLGRSSVDLLLINSVIPFMFVYAKHQNDINLQRSALDWLENIRPENNVIIRRFASLGILASSATQSQALLQLKANYCDNKKCLECRIGHYLLSN